jgi:hypothetical protein
VSDAVRDVLQGPFARFYVLDSIDFCHFLEARDIRIDERDLERFEQEGFFRPLFRLRRRKRPDGGLEGFSTLPGVLKSYLDEGLIEFPTPDDFRPWSSFGEGYDRSVYVFYHATQALLIDMLSNVITIPVTGLYHKGINWLEAGPRLVERYELRKRAFLSSASNMEKSISLLIRLETPYMPVYWDKFKIRLLRDSQEQNWRAWKENVFKPEDLLAASGLSLDEVSGWRDGLALRAIHFDPIGNWYMFVRFLNYARKMDLRGKALRAQDYYEHICLLSLFLEELTGKAQPEPYEIADGSDGSWKKTRYRQDFDLGGPETQKSILREYLPYGERILTQLKLVVEGASEMVSIPPLCHEMLWAIEADAELTDLHGIGNLNRLEPLLESARDNSIKVHLIVDPQGRARDTIDDFVRARLLDIDGFTIWQRNFEEDNFSGEEILTAVNRLLQSRNWSVTKEELQSLGARPTEGS